MYCTTWTPFFLTTQGCSTAEEMRDTDPNHIPNPLLIVRCQKEIRGRDYRGFDFSTIPIRFVSRHHLFFPATFYSSSAADDARLLSSESRLASPGLHVISNSISCFGDADPRRPSDSDSRGLACDCGSVGTESSSIGIDSGYRVWGYLSADDFLDEEVFDSETRPHVDFQTAAILGLG